MVSGNYLDNWPDAVEFIAFAICAAAVAIVCIKNWGFWKK